MITIIIPKLDTSYTLSKKEIIYRATVHPKTMKTSNLNNSSQNRASFCHKIRINHLHLHVKVMTKILLILIQWLPHTIKFHILSYLLISDQHNFISKTTSFTIQFETGNSR